MQVALLEQKEMSDTVKILIFVALCQLPLWIMTLQLTLRLDWAHKRIGTLEALRDYDAGRGVSIADDPPTRKTQLP